MLLIWVCEPHVGCVHLYVADTAVVLSRQRSQWAVPPVPAAQLMQRPCQLLCK